MNVNIKDHDYISSYIDNTKSEKFYYKLFSQYQNDVTLKSWSWWAFAGGFSFLIYRKLYLILFLYILIFSLIVFGINNELLSVITTIRLDELYLLWPVLFFVIVQVLLILTRHFVDGVLFFFFAASVLGLFPLASIMMIRLLIGITSPYFIYKKFLRVKYKLESEFSDEYVIWSRIAKRGGVSRYAIILGFIENSLVILFSYLLF